MSARTVFLHIGAPKTGTTYLQDRLSRNSRTLAEHDIHFPVKSMFADPALFHFRAALDVLEQDWGGPEGHAEGAWASMVRQVRKRSGSVIISHEILAPAPSARIAKVMNDLAGSDIHLVYSARDLVRQLPAAWQQSIKQGRKWRFKRFLSAAEGGEAWFMRAFELPTVLNNWARKMPPENVHVVTVPPKGSEPNELWHRFCRTFGIEPDWAPLDSERSNQSLGIAETELLRRLNRQLDRRTRKSAPHDDLIRQMLNHSELGTRKSRKVTLPPEAYGWADERSQRWIEWIEGAGVDVVGDLDDLRVPEPPEKKWRDPDRVSGKALARAAVDALTLMTQEAANRPDPSRELGARIRNRAERLRQR